MIYTVRKIIRISSCVLSVFRNCREPCFNHNHDQCPECTLVEPEDDKNNDTGNKPCTIPSLCTSLISTSTHNKSLAMQNVDDDLWVLLYLNRHLNIPRPAPLPSFNYYTLLLLSSSSSVDKDEYEDDDDDNVFDDVDDEPQKRDKKNGGDDDEDIKDEGLKDDSDEDEYRYHLLPMSNNNDDLSSNILLFRIRHEHYHHR